MRKIYPILLTMAVVLCGAPAFAVIKTINCGASGSTVIGQYDDETNALTITGNGNMMDDTFWLWRDVCSVIIEDGVTSIGRYAFYDCNKLTSVTIGNSVTNIGIGAFENGCSLISVTIPNSVTSISESAFHGCSNLTSVTIGDNVTSIGRLAFNNCNGLTSVNIPNSVTSIGDGAFERCSSLTSITIPNSVISIGEFAFEYCRGATSITIPESVTSIGRGAFADCNGVKTLSYNTDAANRDKIDEYCYMISDFYNAPLEAVIIGDAVTTIDDDAFLQFKNLKSVTIGNGVKTIGENAFGGCTNLTSVSIGNGVTSIGKYAFDGCNIQEFNEYDNAYYLGNTTNPYLLLYKVKNTNITSCEISNSCRFIWKNAFKDCTEVTSITLPDEIISIKFAAFNNCSSLQSINIPENVTDIGNYAFTGCYNLSSLSISQVTSIGDYAFSYCSKLAGICYEGESEPISVGSSIFEGCGKLSNVHVPESYMDETWCGKEIINDGHQLVTDNPVAATCTESGLTEGSHCSYCGKIITAQEVIPASHTYSTTITEPTCTNVGYTTHTCSVCEYTYNSDTVSANGHTPDSIVFENIIAATCTAAGSYDSVVYCSVCQAEQFREGKSVATNGHSYSNTVTNPTCTEVGYTTHVCSVCEHTYNSDTVAANGHTEVVDAAVAATCTTAGKTEGKHCSVCNEVIVPQTMVAALGHNYGDYVYNNDATTNADGTKTATCSRCGEKDTRPAAGTKLPEPEKGTAVSESATSAINIYAHHNIIVVENATDEIRVFDAMGKMVACGGRDDVHIVSTGTTAITIKTPGVYIVKTGETVKRVIVK
jgi:hypothetical protein